MTLRCPFCNAEEDARVEAVDHTGKQVILVMFDCPFSFRFEPEQMGSEDSSQRFLNDWRKREGDSWLRSIGPLIREREMRGIKSYEESLKSS